MNRTTVSLPDELAAALRREARRRAVPVSEVTRAALEAHLGLSETSERRIIPFAGVGHGSGEAVAENTEEILAAEWADHIAGDR